MIKKSTSRHIIPFSYGTDFQNIPKLYTDNEDFEVLAEIFDDSIKIHEYIQNMYQGKNLKCHQFRLKERTRIKCYTNSSIQRNNFLSIQGNSVNGMKEEYCFNINSIMLMFFDTKIGLLVIDYTINERDIDRYTKTNYFLQSLKSSRIRNLTYHYKTGKNTFAKYPVDLIDVFDDVLSDVDITSFFENGTAHFKFNNETRYPVESLVYNTLLIENTSLDESTLEKKAFLLSRGYKDSYKSTTFNSMNNYVREFDNLFWCISIEGVSNITTCGHDEITNEFFNNAHNPKGRNSIVNVYFYIYVLTIVQRYSLINIAQVISNRTYNLSPKSSVKDLRSNLITLKIDMTNLLLNGIFFDISNNSLYKNYYSELRDAMNIDALLKELEVETSGLDSLTSLLEYQNQEKKRITRRKYTKYGSLFAIIVLGWDASEIVREIFNELNRPIENFPVTSVIAISLFIVCFYFYNSLKKIDDDDELSVEQEL